MSKKIVLSASAVVFCLGVLCAAWIGYQARLNHTKQSQLDAMFIRDFEKFRAEPPEKQKYVVDGVKQKEIYQTSSNQPDGERAKKELLSNPKSEIALRTMAEYEFRKNGRYNEAIRLIKRAAQINPSNSYYYSELGLLTRYTGDDKGAVPYFEKAIAMGGFWGIWLGRV